MTKAMTRVQTVDSDRQVHPLDTSGVRNAFREGLVVLHCPLSVLTLDLDGQPARMHRLREVYRLDPKLSLVTTSKSGTGRHVYVDVREITTVDVLTWMCEAIAAGSDPVRERLSYLRYLNRYPFPWKMFETTQEADRVLAWAKARQLCIQELTESTYDSAMDEFNGLNADADSFISGADDLPF